MSSNSRQKLKTQVTFGEVHEVFDEAKGARKKTDPTRRESDGDRDRRHRSEHDGKERREKSRSSHSSSSSHSHKESHDARDRGHDRHHESRDRDRRQSHSGTSHSETRKHEHRESREHGQSSSQRRHLHEVQEDGEPSFNDPQDPYSLVPEMSRVKVSEPVEQEAKPEQPKKKFASKMRSIVSAVKTAQRLEKSLHRATDATFVPKYATEDMIRSGHLQYDTLYASNEKQTGEMTVNLINAPNNSTMQCGCENINCPFCNLLMSIGNTEIN